jgi:hypothetical protein
MTGEQPEISRKIIRGILKRKNKACILEGRSSA